MNETAVDTHTRPVPGMLDELEIPPAQGWVVHLVVDDRMQTPVWAWCRVSEAGPGYTEVVYTQADGITEVPRPANAQLGPVITKLFC